ncbi:hypothetical protein EBZ35_06280 [bacterium]|nr:hypothetical protein [bacterium]
MTSPIFIPSGFHHVKPSCLVSFVMSHETGTFRIKVDVLPWRDHSIGPKRLNTIFFIMAVYLIGAPPFYINGLRLVVSFPKQESTAPTPFDDTGPYSGCCIPV